MAMLLPLPPSVPAVGGVADGVGCGVVVWLPVFPADPAAPVLLLSLALELLLLLLLLARGAEELEVYGMGVGVVVGPEVAALEVVACAC